MITASKRILIGKVLYQMCTICPNIYLSTAKSFDLFFWIVCGTVCRWVYMYLCDRIACCKFIRFKIKNTVTDANGNDCTQIYYLKLIFHALIYGSWLSAWEAFLASGFNLGFSPKLNFRKKKFTHRLVLLSRSRE